MTIIERFGQLSDLEVLHKIALGDVAMFEIIIRRYNPYLFKIGRSYGFNQPDTEDLIQECYLGAYKNLSKFEGRSSLKTWLVKIMLHQCYQKKQKARYRNEHPSDDLENGHDIPMFSQKNNDTGRRVLNEELKHILEHALLHIPKEYRMVFTLRELNGLSTKETSEVLGISGPNVKVRLSRAKVMLRSEIPIHSNFFPGPSLGCYRTEGVHDLNGQNSLFFFGSNRRYTGRI